jgi:glycosyltransferase involved in cell wall biosynthesis
MVVHGRRPETPAALVQADLAKHATIVDVPGWGDRSLLKEWQALMHLYRCLRDWKPDVIVLHSSFSGLSGALLPLGIPTIYTPHSFASMAETNRLKRQAYRLGESLACWRATVTAGVSESEATVARRRWASRVVAIPNGIPELDDRPAGWVKVSPTAVVIGVGRLVPQRRPIEVAQILDRVRDLAEVSWVGGAGSGVYADKASTELSRRNVPITGWQEPFAVTERLRGAAIYVHWTSWDGLPMTVLEAIAAGAVVVAADTPPNREVLGHDGVYESIEDAVADIRVMLQSPAEWTKRAQQQRSRALAYGARRMQQEWNALLSDVADRR